MLRETEINRDTRTSMLGLPTNRQTQNERPDREFGMPYFNGNDAEHKHDNWQK